jgi:predicted HAD superfamily Cof-like phosphohydrolase
MHLNEMLETVAEFQVATDQSVNLEPTLLSIKESNLRYELMAEENKEYFAAVVQKDKIEIADALVDQMYVLLGTINSHGLQSVFLEAFSRVHENNMTKVGPDGKVLRDASGKILKPSGFKAVDLTDLIN